jgi:glycosyltransferase involved in cell wall biosynthesis
MNFQTVGLQPASGASIVIPVYNEERGLAPLLVKINEVLSAGDLPWEVILVDDGSTDKSGDVARQAGVILLHHQSNRGYGAALKTGIRHARYDIIVIIDGDGTYPPENIPQLLTTFQSNQFDMVVGTRIGGQVAMSFVRRCAKWAITSLAEFIAHQPIPDLNSGMRVFSRNTALRFLDLLPDGFSFTTTITLGMLSNGYLVEYSPIDYHARIGRSKIRPVQDTLSFVFLILRIALYFSPLKIFLPLSGIFLLIGILWGLFTKIVLGQLADVSTSIVATFALEIALLGFLAELINKRTANNFRK